MGSKVIFILAMIWSFGTTMPTPKHAIYLSLTQFTWDQQSGELEMGVRMFTNDLEDALRLQHGRSIPIEGHWDDPDVRKAVQSYVLNKVNLGLHGLNWKAVAFHQQNDATWLALKALQADLPSHLEVESNLLTEVFDTQANVIRFSRGKEGLQAVRLTKEDNKAVFSW